MTTTLAAPISFTASAITELQRLMNDPGFDSHSYLRIGVKGGGCSGLSYVLGFDQKGEKDCEYEAGGVRFIMDRAHELYLAGMQIDWENGLNNRGFTFNNPNASSTCGCGSSFGV